MGLWSRVWNLFRAIIFKNVKEMEVEHAEAVYDSAIEKKVESFHQLKRSVGALVARRERLAVELETAKRSSATSHGGRGGGGGGSGRGRFSQRRSK
jgi:phage shock protein A